MLPPPFDTSETDKLLSTTRAVRKRLDLDRPVDRSVLMECLRLAQQAPTGSNNQDWRWVVVTDPSTRSEIARLYGEAARDYLLSAAAATDDPQTRRVYESAIGLTETLGRVPVHVIPCIRRRPADAPANVVASAFGSILPAAWSFCLALRSRGLGSVWTTLHLRKEREVAELLNIPYEEVSQVALLPVAHTVGTDFKPAARPEPETITYFDRWGSPPASGAKS